MKKLLFKIFVCLILTSPAYSQWQSLGPLGGQVKSIYYDNGTLYAGLDDPPYGIFTSTNNGANWNKLTSVWSGKFIKKFNTLLFSAPRQFNELNRSTNNGLNWSTTSTIGTSSNRMNGIVKLNTDYFLATLEGIFKSTNDGTNWSLVNAGSYSAIAVSGTNLLAGGNGDILLSTNAGNNWSQVATGFAGDRIFTNGNNVFCLYNTLPRGVLVSTNNGLNWNVYNSGLPVNEGPKDFGLIGSTLYILVYPRAIYKSTDIGQTWSFVTNVSANVFCEGISSDGVNLYANSGEFDLNGGVYKSSDSGNNWSKTGLNILNITAMELNNNILYIGGQGGYFVSSTNSGNNWTQIGWIGSTPRRIYFHNSYIFACTDIAYRRSLNNGISWSNVLASQSFDVINTGGNLFASLFSAPYKSTDGGTSWVFVTALSNSRIGKFVQSGNILLGASRSYFDPSHYSTDSGNNWAVLPDTTFAGINTVVAVGDTVFASNTWGFIKSTNNGLNWNYVTTTGANLALANKLLYHNGKLYAAVNGGLFFSNNYGSNWYSLNQGLPGTNITNLIIKSDTLYASVQDAGIWTRGINTITGIVTSGNQLPTFFTIHQNYPNPFNPMTKIKFDIPKAFNTKLAVYDILGKEVAVLVNENLKPGTYEVDFSATGLPSGTYFYRLITNGFTETKKMMVIK